MDKIPNRSNLREGGSILAHGLRMQSITEGKPGVVVMNAGSWLAFSFLVSRNPAKVTFTLLL